MSEATQRVIESESIALETTIELFRKGATFGVQKIPEGRLIVIFNTGTPYSDDSAGKPSETLDEELLGRVLVERRKRMVEDGESHVAVTEEAEK
jgi:hypothetical protein